MNKYFFYLIIIVFLAKTGNVFSNQNIFDVDNIEISSKNNTNRSKLIEHGFKLGFEKLVEKILMNNDAKKISDINISQIKKLILKYQIIENKNIINKDIIKMNISFNREKINEFFYEKNILYSDITKTKIVLFPVLIQNEKFYIFENNYFYSNWNDDEKDTNLIEYILPIENIDDISFIKEKKNSLESADVRQILNKYDIKDYIFLIINSEKVINKIFLKGLSSGNEVVKSFDIIVSDSNLDVEKKETINKIKIHINEIWKSQNLVDVRTPSFLNIFLEIKEENDLLNIQSVLNSIDLIQNHSVVELNKDYAKIKIKYIGKIDKIKNKFTEKNIKINISNNQWTLKLS